MPKKLLKSTAQSVKWLRAQLLALMKSSLGDLHYAILNNLIVTSCGIFLVSPGYNIINLVMEISKGLCNTFFDQRHIVLELKNDTKWSYCLVLFWQ